MGEHTWAEDHGELVRFCAALVTTGEFSAKDIVEVFASPHDWTAEHDCWEFLGKPAALHDLGDLQGWEPNAASIPKDIAGRYAKTLSAGWAP